MTRAGEWGGGGGGDVRKWRKRGDVASGGSVGGCRSMALLCVASKLQISFA